jgi:hypothetical protein
MLKHALCHSQKDRPEPHPPRLVELASASDAKQARAATGHSKVYQPEIGLVLLGPDGNSTGEEISALRIDNRKQSTRANRMGLFSRDKERDRYYLLPGMSRRALRRKQKIMVFWALAVGLVISTVFAAVIYWCATRNSN